MNIGYVLFALAALAFVGAGFVALAAVGWVLMRPRGKVVSGGVVSSQLSVVRPTIDRSNLTTDNRQPTTTPTLEDLVEDFDRRMANQAAAVETRANLAARIAKMLGDEPVPKE